MKVALVHDWLNGLRGGERCLLEFLKLFPDADVYTLLHVPGATSPIIDKRVTEVSLLQRFPGSRSWYRHYLPLFPLAAATLKPRGYDLVISLSHAAAKNVSVPRGTRHICYCFTPMRYIWDQAPMYFGAAAPALWPVLAGLRWWDRKSNERISDFLAISKFIAARIRLYYGRSSQVVYPPVDTSWIVPRIRQAQAEPWFLYAGALVPYKRPDLVVEAFNQLGLPLKVVGSGPMERSLREAAGPTVEIVGRVSDQELGEYYSRAQALIFPAREDFGMVPIEAMAAGCPVIGALSGALRESVVGLPAFESGEPGGDPTGVFFQVRKKRLEQVQTLCDAIHLFLKHRDQFRAVACVERAKLFSPERFRESILTVIGNRQPLGGTDAGEKIRAPLCDPHQVNDPRSSFSVDECQEREDQAGSVQHFTGKGV